MRILFALACLCVPAFAQTDVWKFSRTVTLAGTGYAFTVSLPETGSNQAEMLDYTMQCSADATVSTERNGSAPSATQGTWRPENFDTAPKVSGTSTIVQPAVRIHYASDSTGGTTQDEPFIFPAGFIVPWSTGQVILTGSGTTTNYTIRIASPFTGTCRFQLRAGIRR